MFRGARLELPTLVLPIRGKTKSVTRLCIRPDRQARLAGFQVGVLSDDLGELIECCRET